MSDICHGIVAHRLFPEGMTTPDLAVADNAHRTLAAHVERVNQNRQPGPNVLRVRRIGEALARIQNAATGF